MHIHACTLWSMLVHMESKGQCLVSSSTHLLHVFLKPGVSVNLELTSSVTLTAQQALLISASLPLKSLNYRRNPLCLPLSESVGDLNSAIHACMTCASTTGKTFFSINSSFESYHCKSLGLFEKDIL